MASAFRTYVLPGTPDGLNGFALHEKSFHAAADGAEPAVRQFVRGPGRLLFVCNNPAFFADQHLHLAQAARRAGHTVLVAAPDWFGAERIKRAGFAFLPIQMERGKPTLRAEWRAFRDLVRLYQATRPDLVYHVTLKPILYGTLAARLAKVGSVVNANTGLGFAWIDSSIRTRLIRALIGWIYPPVIRHPNRRDLFLNRDDRALFLSDGMADVATSTVINGPGVDLRSFFPSTEPPGDPVVILPARLLWHKGVAEFVEAARILRQDGVRARFALVGDADSGNLASVPRSTLMEWNMEGIVEWWGHCDDMPSVYARAHIVALPSYREGLGKVLAEAGACGRPVVASDVAGCREIVRNEVNGLLVPARDSVALAAALRRLIANRDLRNTMGRIGRQVVEGRFGEEAVAKRTLAVIEDLLYRAPLESGRLRLVSVPTPGSPKALPADAVAAARHAGDGMSGDPNRVRLSAR